MCPSRSTALFFLSVALGAPVFAQASEPQDAVRVEVSVQAQAPELELGADQLLAGLSETNLDRREAYLDRLARRLGREDEAGLAARSWLAERAKGQGELAWTARIALREVRRLDESRSLVLDPITGLLGGAAAPMRPPGPGLRILGSPHGAPQEAPDGSTELEVWIAEASEGVQRFPVANLEAMGGTTFELRCGPGVTRLRILEAPQTTFVIPGGHQNEGTEAPRPEQVWTALMREYSGGSLVEILTENPDLIEMLPFQVAGIPTAKSSLRTDVLGVFTHVLTEERRVALGLPPGVGLEVARVVPGTIAHALGVDRGAVILEVCGQPVTGGDGITNVLGETREAAAAEGNELEVDVVWLDAWGQRLQRIWRGPLSD